MHGSSSSSSSSSRYFLHGFYMVSCMEPKPRGFGWIRSKAHGGAGRRSQDWPWRRGPQLELPEPRQCALQERPRAHPRECGPHVRTCAARRSRVHCTCRPLPPAPVCLSAACCRPPPLSFAPAPRAVVPSCRRIGRFTGGMLVFFPSYAAMERSLDYWSGAQPDSRLKSAFEGGSSSRAAILSHTRTCTARAPRTARIGVPSRNHCV